MGEFARWPLGGLVLSLCLIGATSWVAYRYFRPSGRENVNISVPEILGVLGRGRRELKPLALRAILPILEGEVDMLQEIFDEACGVHNKIPPEGNIFRVLLRDLLESPKGKFAQEIISFFLICTQYDVGFDDTDEWNALVLKIITLLSKQSLKEIEACVAHGAPLEPVLKRLRASPRTEVKQNEKPAVEFSGEAVDLLSWNTRLECGVCGKIVAPAMTTAKRCHCGNAVYCSAMHHEEDHLRHERWCS